ncbi:hypothetical protein M2451_003916 [Dysgonomonas sp. PFB1-18]|uniref:hypothetical protein n=1 Tax=unclassified Dysgonomonas TaxID=2630389 RepID=UPI00247632BE|nr:MULTISPECIES: hypothetical protein [unclassified Dysgonomonas]MDH6311027.1 hypothetical protein [Dysgonomonas sp. PF1-14]MDH6337876.1 hypothetical protein [Dysgonomonas sp. PF1-16]MDH6382575.1 hypothetical protein [Dysgonomonas sp. PFB1-18]MDH6398008.1 hypothetical protein [Dysgonomonas sp. PF1-23]
MPVSYKVLFAGLLICSFAGCTSERKTLSIKYKLTITSPYPCNIFISYKDVNDYVMLTTDSDWMQEVCLSSGDAASLLVIVDRNCDAEGDMLQQSRSVSVTGEIIQGEKIIAERSDRVVLLSFPVFSF